MAFHQDIDWARRNGRSSGQFFQARPLNVSHVVDLLVEASAEGRNPFLRRPANALIETMARSPWRVSAGPHEGGHGGDTSWHITVQIDATRDSYHLGLHMNGHVARISGPDRTGAQVTWAPPGAPVP